MRTKPSTINRSVRAQENLADANLQAAGAAFMHADQQHRKLLLAQPSFKRAVYRRAAPSPARTSAPTYKEGPGARLITPGPQRPHPSPWGVQDEVAAKNPGNPRLAGRAQHRHGRRSDPLSGERHQGTKSLCDSGEVRRVLSAILRGEIVGSASGCLFLRIKLSLTVIEHNCATND